MATTIVLISGANRGIGKELLKRYLVRPNYIVIAANRNPEHASSTDLVNIPKAADTQLIIVKVDASDDKDAANSVVELQSQGIDHIDLVIANAGVSYAFGKVSDISLKDVRDHFEPNVYGVLRLYQATIPLLRKSKSPKWVTMGSIAGSIEVRSFPPFPYFNASKRRY
jgi:norsolorinic acid ketoreductase